MVIRQERLEDRQEVYRLVQAAFAATEHSDGNEQDLVEALRCSPSFLPELSLVAVEEGKIVGHILFTRASVGGTQVLALAPLSVLPERQGQGIGLALMEQGHRIAAALGYGWSIVLGHAGYYPKVGYRPAAEFGIYAPFEVPPETFQAIRLDPEAPELSGLIRYDPAFGSPPSTE